MISSEYCSGRTFSIVASSGGHTRERKILVQICVLWPLPFHVLSLWRMATSTNRRSPSSRPEFVNALIFKITNKRWILANTPRESIRQVSVISKLSRESYKISVLPVAFTLKLCAQHTNNISDYLKYLFPQISGFVRGVARLPIGARARWSDRRRRWNSGHWSVWTDAASQRRTSRPTQRRGTERITFMCITRVTRWSRWTCSNAGSAAVWWVIGFVECFLKKYVLVRTQVQPLLRELW